MAKQRSQIINDALDMIVRNYPDESSKSLKGMSDAIDNFFLTDFCEEEDGAVPGTPKNNIVTPAKRTTGKKHRKDRTLGSGIGIIDGIGNLFAPSKDEAPEKKEVTFTSPVVPISKKTRRSVMVRAADEEMLQASTADLAVDDDDSGKAAPTTPKPAPVVVQPGGSPLSGVFANNPYAVVGVIAVVLGVLRRAQFKTVTMDSDYVMLVSFAFFCFGLNWPRPPSVVVQKAAAPPSAARRRRTVVTTGQQGPAPGQLVRASMMVSPTVLEAAKSVREWDTLGEEEEEEPAIQSPMETYPEDAELGEYFNCVSEPDCKDFHVRGPKYFKDKVKVPSGPFLFPTRGVDLFLTDDAPENVGRYVVVSCARLFVVHATVH